jgi:hypothetical protein
MKRRYGSQGNREIKPKSILSWNPRISFSNPPVSFFGMVQKKVTLLCHCEKVAQPLLKKPLRG